MGCATSSSAPANPPSKDNVGENAFGEGVAVPSLQAFSSNEQKIDVQQENEDHGIGGDIVPTPHKAKEPNRFASPAGVASDLHSPSRKALPDMLADLQSPSGVSAVAAASTPAVVDERPVAVEAREHEEEGEQDDSLFMSPMKGNSAPLQPLQGGGGLTSLESLAPLTNLRGPGRPRAALEVPRELFEQHDGFEESEEYNSSMSEIHPTPVSKSQASHVSRVGVMFASPSHNNDNKEGNSSVLGKKQFPRTPKPERIAEDEDDIDDLADFMNEAILHESVGNDDSLFLASKSPVKHSSADDTVSMDGYQHHQEADNSFGEDSMLLEARARQAERVALEASKKEQEALQRSEWERQQKVQNIPNLRSDFNNDAFRRVQQYSAGGEDDKENIRGDVMRFDSGDDEEENNDLGEHPHAAMHHDKLRNQQQFDRYNNRDYDDYDDRAAVAGKSWEPAVAKHSSVLDSLDDDLMDEILNTHL